VTTGSDIEELLVSTEGGVVEVCFSASVPRVAASITVETEWITGEVEESSPGLGVVESVVLLVVLSSDGFGACIIVVALGELIFNLNVGAARARFTRRRGYTASGSRAAVTVSYNSREEKDVRRSDRSLRASGLRVAAGIGSGACFDMADVFVAAVCWRVLCCCVVSRDCCSCM